MNKKAIFSWGYWFSALSLGLLLHPYPTLRKMIRDRLLRPLVLLPAVSGTLLWIGTYLIVRVGGLVLGAFNLGLPVVLLLTLGFLFWWVVWFLVLWQIVLLYLFVRFWVVLRGK